MMRWLATVITVLGMSAGPPPAAAQETSAETPVIVTGGEGLVRVAPQRAYVELSAESRASRPQDAQRQNTAAMSTVLDQLRAAGLDAAAIRTIAYDVQAEYDYPSGRRVLRGYVARNTVEARVDDLDRLGEIIDAAVSAGATAVSGIRFDVRDRPALERQALREAVADARARAEAIAESAGRTIDRILRIDDLRASAAPPVRPMLRTLQLEAADASETPVAPGEIEVRAQVSLTVAIR